MSEVFVPRECGGVITDPATGTWTCAYRDCGGSDEYEHWCIYEELRDRRHSPSCRRHMAELMPEYGADCTCGLDIRVRELEARGHA